MKSHLISLGMHLDVATDHTRTINNAELVYDNFKGIADNLMVCSDIAIRRLSLHQLYLAKDMSWCLVYQEQFQGQRKKPRLLDYDEEAFDDLLKCVEGHEAYRAVSDDLKRSTALISRLQKKLLESQLKK